jgi:hypothetical protein
MIGCDSEVADFKKGVVFAGATKGAGVTGCWGAGAA